MEKPRGSFFYQDVISSCSSMMDFDVIYVALVLVLSVNYDMLLL